MISDVSAFFFPHQGRQLYCCRFGPSIATASQVLLYFPPFTEEANRCRPMVALQARNLAEEGVATILMDYYGTGDSSGEFIDTTVEIWRRDALALGRSLVDAGARNLSLWGLRFGALLASEIAASAELPVKHLLLWQPAISGKTLMAQFLRIRVAAALGGETGETAKDLRAKMVTGNYLEVAGYELTGQLADDLDAMHLHDQAPSAVDAVYWLELASHTPRFIAPASEKIVAAWQGAGIAVASQAVAGSRFWDLPEITLAPDLITATQTLFNLDFEVGS